MALQSRSISAVFPDPTGPPMPMRSGPFVLDISDALLHIVIRASSRRTPGPITPGGYSDRRPLPQRQNEMTRRMGPGVRRDDALMCQTRHHPHDLNNLVYWVSC